MDFYYKNSVKTVLIKSSLVTKSLSCEIFEFVFFSSSRSCCSCSKSQSRLVSDDTTGDSPYKHESQAISSHLNRSPSPLRSSSARGGNTDNRQHGGSPSRIENVPHQYHISRRDDANLRAADRIRKSNRSYSPSSLSPRGEDKPRKSRNSLSSQSNWRKVSPKTVKRTFSPIPNSEKVGKDVQGETLDRQRTGDRTIDGQAYGNQGNTDGNQGRIGSPMKFDYSGWPEDSFDSGLPSAEGATYNSGHSAQLTHHSSGNSVKGKTLSVEPNAGVPSGYEIGHSNNKQAGEFSLDLSSIHPAASYDDSASNAAHYSQGNTYTVGHALRENQDTLPKLSAPQSTGREIVTTSIQRTSHRTLSPSTGRNKSRSPSPTARMTNEQQVSFEERLSVFLDDHDVQPDEEEAAVTRKPQDVSLVKIEIHILSCSLQMIAQS